MNFCKLCGASCFEEDFCYGCDEYICEECDIGTTLIGKHEYTKHGEE